jgi:hypothetical protein
MGSSGASEQDIAEVVCHFLLLLLFVTLFVFHSKFFID